LCYVSDPRLGPGVLNRPDLVILRGKVFRLEARQRRIAVAVRIE